MCEKRVSYGRKKVFGNLNNENMFNELLSNTRFGNLPQQQSERNLSMAMYNITDC